MEASELLSSLTLFLTCNSVNACFLVFPLWLLVMDNKLVYYVYYFTLEVGEKLEWETHENLMWSSPSLPSLALSWNTLPVADWLE